MKKKTFKLITKIFAGFVVGLTVLFLIAPLF